MVVFAPEAESQLIELYAYIAQAASPTTAERYLQSLVDHCESLVTFPQRGTLREDIRPGLRITHYRSRTAIAFSVQQGRIEILGIFHGGRNHSHLLRDPSR